MIGHSTFLNDIGGQNRNDEFENGSWHAENFADWIAIDPARKIYSQTDLCTTLKNFDRFCMTMS